MQNLELTPTMAAKQIETLQLYMAVIAHEVKNTVGAIPGLCEFVEKGLNPELHLRAAKLAATSTVELVDNLMTSIKLINGAIAVIPQMALIEVGQWLASIVNRSRFYDLNTNRKLKLSIPEELQFAQILTDNKLTAQVLRNLIINAIKFSYTGTVIEVGCYNTDTALVITVSNYGAPIPSEKVAHIFQPFTQLQKGEVGSGLGLYISKLFAEALGGSLTATSSAITNLTTFTVTIPDCIGFTKEVKIRA